MVIRFPNPGGTAALMTKESIDHAVGRQQTLVDRARDATRGMSGAQPRLVLDDGTVLMQDIFVFRRTGVDENGMVQGEFTPTGIRPRRADELAAAGINLATGVFEKEA